MNRLPIEQYKQDISGQPFDLNIFPNPVVNDLNISVDGFDVNSKSVISLISASGVVINTIQPKAINKILKVDVSFLSTGMYFIRFINVDKIIYRQFVKL